METSFEQVTAVPEISMCTSPSVACQVSESDLLPRVKIVKDQGKSLNGYIIIDINFSCLVPCMYVGVNVNIMCSVSSSDNRNIVTIETGCQTIGDISFSNPITSTPVIHNIDSEVESENDNDLD